MADQDVIFSGVSVNGVETLFTPRLSRSYHRSATLYVWGTWAGASITVAVSPDGVKFFPLSFTGGALTADGFVTIDVAASALQITISGAGAGASLNAVLL